MYACSLRSAGQTSAYRFCVLFNPAASGMGIVLQRVTVTGYAVGIALSATPLLLSRVTAVAGGVQEMPEDITPFNTTYPLSQSDIRRSNPTVTLAQDVSAFAPPIQATVVTGYAASMQRVDFNTGWDRFVLAEGEGITIHQEVAGLAAHQYSINLFWAEQAA